MYSIHQSNDPSGVSHGSALRLLKVFEGPYAQGENRTRIRPEDRGYVRASTIKYGLEMDSHYARHTEEAAASTVASVAANMVESMEDTTAKCNKLIKGWTNCTPDQADDAVLVALKYFDKKYELFWEDQAARIRRCEPALNKPALLVRVVLSAIQLRFAALGEQIGIVFDERKMAEIKGMVLPVSAITPHPDVNNREEMHAWNQWTNFEHAPLLKEEMVYALNDAKQTVKKAMGFYTELAIGFPPNPRMPAKYNREKVKVSTDRTGQLLLDLEHKMEQDIIELRKRDDNLRRLRDLVDAAGMPVDIPADSLKDARSKLYKGAYVNPWTTENAYAVRHELAQWYDAFLRQMTDLSNDILKLNNLLAAAKDKIELYERNRECSKTAVWLRTHLPSRHKPATESTLYKHLEWDAQQTIRGAFAGHEVVKRSAEKNEKRPKMPNWAQPKTLR